MQKIKPIQKKIFYSDCVNWPMNKVDQLNLIIDNAIDISRRTFLKHVDRDVLKSIETDLGYDSHYKQGLTMAADWAVSYHRSKFKDKFCYYFRYSAIEYIFT